MFSETSLFLSPSKVSKILYLVKFNRNRLFYLTYEEPYVELNFNKIYLGSMVKITSVQYSVKLNVQRGRAVLRKIPRKRAEKSDMIKASSGSV